VVPSFCVKLYVGLRNWKAIALTVFVSHILQLVVGYKKEQTVY
jgi:hypothetical protein